MTRRRIIGWVGVTVAILVIGLAALYWWAFNNRLPARAKTILERAESYELLSLYQKDMPKEEDGRYFGWRVLGKTVVNDPETREQIRAALYKDVSTAEGHNCFWPRHAIHAEHDGHSVDIVICFQCEWVYIYFDGQTAEKQRLGTTKTGQSLFDAVLQAAGIPLNEPEA
jgi:hypothetical protein